MGKSLRDRHAGQRDPIHGEIPSIVCKDCGQVFTAYYYRLHRGPSYNESCPSKGLELEVEEKIAPRRGRPPKVKQPETTTLELKVATILLHCCGIPGCSEKNHLEDARTIINLVENK